MEPKVNDQRHQSFQELLGAAAFGTLTADEHALLASHLNGCDECRAELATFQAIGTALPITLDERVPSPELRDRIEAAVRSSSNASTPFLDTWQNATMPETQASHPNPVTNAGPTAVPPPGPTAVRTLDRRPGGNVARLSRGVSPSMRSRYLWATAALVLLALLAGAVAGRMLFADDSDDAGRGEAIALQMNPPIPNTTGELTYMPEERVFKLSMHNMPAAPADHVYQVWLIDAEGPEPVGMVDQSSGQFAVAADRSQYDTLAITVEPGPLGSQKPSAPPIMTAPLQESIDP